jgi:geranylgeranylglycerol-phosphate geranylgeranyltransferase
MESNAGAALALSLVLAGAFALNDVIDREADAINVPTRPIPSGVLSVRTVLEFAIVCDIGAIAAAMSTRSARVQLLTLVLLVLGFAYSLALQRMFLVKNLVMAFVGACVPIMGSGSIEARTLAAAIAIFILQKEIAADVVDRQGDEQMGLRTLPIVLGVRPTLFIVAALNVAFIVTVVVLGLPLGMTGVGLVNIVASTLAAFRDERAIHALLTLQKGFLVAGVLLAWQV